jgi:hypothetical protein
MKLDFESVLPIYRKHLRPYLADFLGRTYLETSVS